MVQFRLSAFADELSPDVDRQIEWLCGHGVDLLEVRGVDGQSVAEITPEKAREVRAKLDRVGMGVSAVGSPAGKIGVDEPLEPHLEQFRRLCEIADILGTRRMRIFSFFIPDGEKPEKYRGEVMRRLGEFLKIARPHGITLCHENEKGIYGESPERCLDIYEEFGGEIKNVFDHANYISCGYLPFPHAFEKVGGTLAYMHIKDADVNAEMVPTGEGVGRIPETLAAVNELYEGEFILTLEPHLMTFDGLKRLEKEGHLSTLGNRYQSPEHAFGVALDALRKYI